MTKRLACVLALSALLLCSCTLPFAPEPTPTPVPTATPVPTPTPTPEGMALWLYRAGERFNMEYKDFAEYWSYICDEFYGKGTEKLLSASNLSDKDAEIEHKRGEYADKYGADWHYRIIDYTVLPLNDSDCVNFAAELEDIADRAARLAAEAETWGDAEWSDYAAAHDCTEAEAKAVFSACTDIEKACRDAAVTRAQQITLNLEFTGSKCGTLTTTEQNTVYEVNGVYVSELLIDSSIALLNMVI